MKKSQFIFAIMSTTYFVVAILNLRGYIVVSENILFGLSMSALLSSLSDVLSHIVNIRTSQNEFGYIVLSTSDFLEEKISHNICNSLIDTRNVKLNVESMSKGYKKAVHPIEYHKGKSNALIHFFSQICFVLSIAVFILSPFPLLLFQQSYSVFLTLIAFALMCLNLYFEDIISGINQKKEYFFNDKQIIIQMAYSDFMYFLSSRLYHYEEYISIANKQEDKSDAHT